MPPRTDADAGGGLTEDLAVGGREWRRRRRRRRASTQIEIAAAAVHCCTRVAAACVASAVQCGQLMYFNEVAMCIVFTKLR